MIEKVTFNFGYVLLAILIICAVLGYAEIGRAVYVSVIHSFPKCPTVLAVIIAMVWPLLIIYVAICVVAYLIVLLVHKVNHKI